MKIIDLAIFQFAQVSIKDNYAFGFLKSLGEGIGFLVGPTFMIATVSVSFYLIIGAFRFLISGGDKEKIASARGMITHAIIAFIMLILLFLVVQFVPNFLGLKGFQIIKL
ncbi:hypothetical protein HYS91_01810 [Candidatus Daviesbacteria bacterium]|nr:hypothetical protein [Candidatus Daviesbacteria bacterium]